MVVVSMRSMRAAGEVEPNMLVFDGFALRFMLLDLVFVQLTHLHDFAHRTAHSSSSRAQPTSDPTQHHRAPSGRTVNDDFWCALRNHVEAPVLGLEFALLKRTTVSSIQLLSNIIPMRV